MKKKLKSALLATAMLVLGTFSVSNVSASPITVFETIDFDSVSNGDKTYTSPGGFFFTPTNFSSDSKCDPPAGSGNGSCLKESGQGTITTMTRVDGENFSLLSFYFNLVGNGTTVNGVKRNPITVTGSNLATATYDLGNFFPNVYPELPEDGTIPAASILKNKGYEAFFLTSPYDIFTDVSWIRWTSFSSANVRLDDIQASYTYDDGNHGPPEVPLPAAGLLLMSALGGLGMITRKRKSKHTAGSA